MSQTTITLLFLVFTIISFILEKIPLGLTASICAIGLTLTGVVDATTTFSQYVNSNVILCVGMFVVGQALFETGMANKIGGLVTKFARTEKTLIIAIMVIVGVMSGFLSNTGTAAVLICSAVVIAAFVLRMPVEMNVADACGMQQKVNVLSSSMHNRQAEDYLNDAGEFCISQTVLREGKPSVVPQVRRIGLRFLPVSHMTQQWLLVQRILTSKPKFLVPPARRLIVGRYIRANPVCV